MVFTEYTDSARWIAEQLEAEGYSARLSSGPQSKAERDEARKAFMRSEFQVIVTTDAGNEGIDLQAAHVLVNDDIPWSLVRLEQRMGRIHCVGQQPPSGTCGWQGSRTGWGPSLAACSRQGARCACRPGCRSDPLFQALLERAWGGRGSPTGATRPLT